MHECLVSQGAFPGGILLRPPPVVVDANVLRNDILRACRTGQRTVLVTAANAGLLRLFCARHVYDEVIDHSGDWTVGGPVTRDAFLRRWLLEYLPLIRVVPVGKGQQAPAHGLRRRLPGRAAPLVVPQAAGLPPGAVLGRACLHTLARSPGCSARSSATPARSPRYGADGGRPDAPPRAGALPQHGRRQGGYGAPTGARAPRTAG
jgi:hypothetical protein